MASQRSKSKKAPARSMGSSKVPERRNLSQEVASGHTYRNAWVRLRVAGQLADR